MTDTYVINLLPAETDAALLSDIKSYFYEREFKWTTKGAPSRPHLTLAKLSNPLDWAVFEVELMELLRTQEKIIAPIARVSDEVTPTTDHPEGEGWVALVFADMQIQELYSHLDVFLTRQGINRNNTYVDAIRQKKGGHLTTFDCIANHINLCNGCKSEKVQEAKAYIRATAPAAIVFDTLIIRRSNTDDEDVRCEIKLN